MFSLATDGQLDDSSRSNQPPQQLDLAQSFNDMRVSPSSTPLHRLPQLAPATHYQAAAAAGLL